MLFSFSFVTFDHARSPFFILGCGFVFEMNFHDAGKDEIENEEESKEIKEERN